MATSAKAIGDIVMRVLVGILFVCIGIQGIGDFGGNALYSAIDNEVANIILGIVILLAGILLVATIFLSGIKKSFTTASMLIVLAVWVVVIVFADFVEGLSGVKGIEWFTWAETFIYHLLILASIAKVAMPAMKKVAKAAK